MSTSSQGSWLQPSMTRLSAAVAPDGLRVAKLAQKPVYD